MKITEVRTLPLSIPLRQETPLSPWAAGLGQQILIQIFTDAGITGLGEAFAYGVPQAVCAVIDTLKLQLMGADPTQPEAIIDQLARTTRLYGRRGLGLFALSGIDIALWDILGQVKRQPLYKLLGGTETKRLPAYVSMLRYQTPPEVAKVVARCLEAGFLAIKLHQLDLKSIEMARRVAGNRTELMLDVNCAWEREEALSLARALAPYRLAWLEEPVWPPDDYSSLAYVRQGSGIPIACGENEGTLYGFQHLLAREAVDIVQPSVTKVGGITEWRRIAEFAARRGVHIAPHSFYFGPGFIATLHLMAALPGCTYIEVAGCSLETPLLQEPLDFRDGTLGVPEGPGLGVTLNNEVIGRYPADFALIGQNLDVSR